MRAVILFFAFAAFIMLSLMAFVVVTAAIDKRSERRGKTARRVIVLEALVDRLDSLAFDNREINPELSVQIIDEIRTVRRSKQYQLTKES